MGLDAARGLTVLVATVLLVAAWAGADVGPTVAVGLGPTDLVAPAFLVLAGVGIGWRRETAGPQRAAPRARRRALLLVLAGAVVVAARSAGDPAALAADELWRLAAATGLAAWLLRAPRAVAVALTPLLLALPAVLIGAGPTGRGLRALPPTATWRLEEALGLPTGGVPLASLPAAVGMVLVGVGLGTWMARRPGGPASAGALLTVAIWAAGVTLVVGQFRAPVPALLDLTVAVAGIGAGCLVLAAGHLVAHLGEGTLLEAVSVAVGRTALPFVAVGAALLALVARVPSPGLPSLAAVTTGGLVATVVAVLARRVTLHVERLAA